jgi:hypothetical protein
VKTGTLIKEEGPYLILSDDVVCYSYRPVKVFVRVIFYIFH